MQCEYMRCKRNTWPLPHNYTPRPNLVSIMNILRHNKQEELTNPLISYIFDLDRSLKGQFGNHCTVQNMKHLCQTY